jgi:VanZ family protein
MTVRFHPALRILSLICVIAVAIQLCLMPEPAFAERIVEATWDKAVHATVYGGIAFLLWVAFNGRGAILIWALVTLVGAIDETMQIYTPGRDADLHDFYADALGAMAVLLVLKGLASVRFFPVPASSYSGD